MRFRIDNPEKVLKIATIGVVIYLLCFGIAMVFFPIRPFWNDEWRLIYNLKFKNVHQLWGTLDLLQQCPRVYLTALKKFTSFFDYSYISLRLPALIITFVNVFFCFYLKKKIFPAHSIFNYLFILILISSQTFTDYMTQVKQYEMELFLCMLALWQLMTLCEISNKGVSNKYKYFLLCCSFLFAPFFSYTYPIAVAPIFPIVIISSVMALKNKTLTHNKTKLLPALYLPLAIVCVSIVIFYFIDVRQLMADNSMYISYKRMLGNDRGERNFIKNFWELFSLVGSGALYEILFGILGIASFFYGLYRFAKTKMHDYELKDYFKLYALLLLMLTLCLFLSGKLLGGVARLTAFTVPSISVLIVSFLEDLKKKYSYIKLANVIAGIIFLGLFGNIISTCINTFTYPEYANRIKTYRNTALALKQATLNKIPILYSDGVRGDPLPDTATAPGKIDSNTITPDQIAGVDRLCTEVILKVNPEYKTWAPIPVYLMPDAKWTAEYIKQLPPQFTSAIVGDGINFAKLNR